MVLHLFVTLPGAYGTEPRLNPRQGFTKTCGGP